MLCSGVSVVWSALDGCTLYLFYSNPRNAFNKDEKGILSAFLAISWLYSLCLWVYYMVVADWLTSLAHLLAVLLGGLISHVMCKCGVFNAVDVASKERSRLLEENVKGTINRY